MKHYRTAFVLLAIIGVLGGVAYWDEWKTTQEETEKENKNKLVAISADDVTKVVYFWQNDKESKTVNFTLEKNGELWNITSPRTLVADQAAVKTFLTTLTTYKFEKVIEDEDPGFGIKDGKRWIEISGKDGSSVRVTIGNAAPVGYSSYLSTSDQSNVFLGSQSIDLATRKNLKDFRDKSLVGVPLDQLKSAKFARKGESEIKLIKENGEYEIIAPNRMAADFEVITNLFENLNGAKAVGFIDDPTSEDTAKLSPAFVTINWQLSGGEKGTLQFAEVGGELWASRDGDALIYKLDSAFKEKIDKTLSDFRNKRVARFDSADLESVEVNSKVYTRAEGDWYLASEVDGLKDEGKEKPKTHQFVQNLVVDLEFAKAKDFFPATKVKTKTDSAPEHRIILTFKGDLKRSPLKAEAWVDGANDKVYLLRIDSGQVVYHVEKSVFSALDASVKKSADLSGKLEQTNH